MPTLPSTLPTLTRLPWRLDPAPLRAALATLGEAAWIDEPGSGLGRAAIPLVTVSGTLNRDLPLAGPLRPTATLERCPPLRAALAAIGAPVGRCRLVRLPARSHAPAVTESSHHWSRRALLCIPLVTARPVVLAAGPVAARMAPGEAWRLDVTRRHRLHNRSARACVHLLAELRADAQPTGSGHALALEPHRFEVLEPASVAALVARIRAEPAPWPMSPTTRAAFLDALDRIEQRWRLAFARFGHDPAGELAYQDVLLELREHVLPRLRPHTDGRRAAAVLDTVLSVCPPSPRRLVRVPSAARKPTPEPLPAPRFERPVFVVSPPRSGSTLLFELLRRFPEPWSIGGESHAVIRGIPSLHPAARGYDSDRLLAAHAPASVAAALRASFAAQLVDRHGRRLAALPLHARPPHVRLLEKTPANALRIPFLRAVFPDAVFVQLLREPHETICSLVEGWRSRRFLAYRDLPGWPHRDWSFLLPPGWRAMADRPLVEIATFQWRAAHEAIERDLAELPPARRCQVRYHDLIQRPRDVLATIAALAELRWDDQVERMLGAPLPLTRVTLSAPAPDKWRRHEHELSLLLPGWHPPADEGSRLHAAL